jgi:hypothetical protein
MQEKGSHNGVFLDYWLRTTRFLPGALRPEPCASLQSEMLKGFFIWDILRANSWRAQKRQEFPQNHFRLSRKVNWSLNTGLKNYPLLFG